MRGSLLIKYEDDIEFGGDYLNIFSNGNLLKRIYNTTNKLYSIPINLGDVISFQYVPIGGFELGLNLIRKDYTTDNDGVDNGIKQTIITSGAQLTDYVFTATTISTAYDFEYILESTVVADFQIWTEASEPIMTENYEYLNKEF